MSLITIFFLGIALVGGLVLGYYLRLIIALGKKGSMELEIKRMMISTKEEAQRILDDAKKRTEEKTEELHREEKKKENEFKETQDRLIKKESLLDARQVEIDSEVENIKIKIEDIKKAKEKVDAMETQKVEEVEKISKMSQIEAREELFKMVEKNAEEDLLIRTQKLEISGDEKLNNRAKEILATAIQRLASSTASEMTTTNVNIPSDEIKGKIIGKEGRNIRAFERSAGVELIVDDTPGSLVISSFDPIRRQIARLALENLILDGRIQPAKIEEMVEKAKVDINKIIKEKGEQA